MDIEVKLKEIFCKVAKLEDANVADSSLLKYDLVITSLTYVKILTEVEDEFDIEIPDGDYSMSDEMTFGDFKSKMKGIIFCE